MEKIKHEHIYAFIWYRIWNMMCKRDRMYCIDKRFRHIVILLKHDIPMPFVNPVSLTDSHIVRYLEASLRSMFLERRISSVSTGRRKLPPACEVDHSAQVCISIRHKTSCRPTLFQRADIDRNSWGVCINNFVCKLLLLLADDFICLQKTKSKDHRCKRWLNQVV